MKKNLIIVPIMVGILSLLVFSCVKDKKLDIASLNTVTKTNIVLGKVVTNNGDQRKITSDQVTINNYLKSKKITHRDAKLLLSGEYVYLVYKEILNDGFKNVAQEFKQTDQNLLEETGVIHECDGSCGGSNNLLITCTGCSFVYTGNKITGCKCNHNSAVCCHKISSSGE